MGWRPEDSGHRMAGSRPDGDARDRWLVMVLSAYLSERPICNRR